MRRIEDIQKSAEAGDPTAQYQLATLLAQRGDREAAKPWLAKAAAAGHPGALFTRACELLEGRPTARKAQEAIVMLQQGVSSGGAAAARQLAVLTALGLGVEADWARAVGLVFQAARLGHPAALREAAALAFMARAPKAAPQRFLRMAAQRGDAAAAGLGLVTGGVFKDDEAATVAARLAASGAPDVGEAGTAAASAPNAPQIEDFDTVEKAVSADFPPPASSQIELHGASPRVVRANALLTPLECAYVMLTSAPLLTPSAVVDPRAATSKRETYRTSDGAMFGVLDLDLALIAIWRKLCNAAASPISNAEFIGVLRYAPGQEYRPHHDYLPEDDADYSEVRRTGQRSRTLLVLLNEAFTGGETVFPALDLAWRGGRGDALIFENVELDGEPLANSLHAGAPVISGEKWLLSLWLREKRFWTW